MDASVLLRRVLGAPGFLTEWQDIERPIGSVLVEVECLRVLDRIRIEERRTEDELASWREAALAMLGTMEQIEMSRAVLARASEPLPTVLATLDALHLASALVWREATSEELVVATHDHALSRAARAHGFPVVGI
ncbi:MAG TPA: PIN domain-containing protein [Gemmatimonadota bacterium]|nr:PIN domain-containing protein [Gemmatimonadota bacterium]